MRARIANVISASRTPMQGALIVVVENEPAILDGMRTLVTGWGADVIAEAGCRHRPMQAIERDGRTPTGFVVDYHLDRGHGIAAIADLREKYGARYSGDPDHRRPQPESAGGCACGRRSAC